MPSHAFLVPASTPAVAEASGVEGAPRRGSLTTELVTVPDGVPRPAWAARSEAARTYFDGEWGRPVHAERGLYELVVLLVFAGGLTWATVLGRRAALREAFAGFDPDAVAAFTDRHVGRLVDDARIIRNRRKIEAAVTNARATCALRESGGLARLVHGDPDREPASDVVDLAAMPKSGPRAVRLSEELTGAGFVRLGPVAAQALLLASGAIPVRRAGGPERTSSKPAGVAVHREPDT